MSEQSKITTEELQSMFGPELPIEVAEMIFNAPPDATIGEIRAKVRAYAASLSTEPMAQEGGECQTCFGSGMEGKNQICRDCDGSVFSPEVHPIERLWREVGLPEYFLGNGGTNHKLYALYDAITASPAPAQQGGEVVAWRWRMIGDNRWSVLDHEPDISDAIRDRCEVEPLFASPVAGAGEVVAWPGKCPECGCHTKADIQRADGSPDGRVRCIGCKRVFGVAHPVAPSEEVTVEPRRPLDDDKPDGYLESDKDYVLNNIEAAVTLLDTALQTRSKQP